MVLLAGEKLCGPQTASASNNIIRYYCGISLLYSKRQVMGMFGGGGVVRIFGTRAKQAS